MNKAAAIARSVSRLQVLGNGKGAITSVGSSIEQTMVNSLAAGADDSDERRSIERRNEAQVTMSKSVRSNRAMLMC